MPAHGKYVRTIRIKIGNHLVEIIDRIDRLLIDFLRAEGRDFLVVATKADKLSGNKLRNALTGLAADHAVESLLPYSARTGTGRAELWREISARSATS